MVIGVSTLVRKSGQQLPTLGTILRLVSFLNKLTVANFNYGNCGYIYRMNLPSPKIQIPIFQGNNFFKKKKFPETLLQTF